MTHTLHEYYGDLHAVDYSRNSRDWTFVSFTSARAALRMERAARWESTRLWVKRAPELPDDPGSPYPRWTQVSWFVGASGEQMKPSRHE